MKHSINKINPFLNLGWISILFLIIVFLFINPLSPQTEDTSSQDKKKVERDIVSDLTATLSPDSISIELKWTPPQEEGDVVIARSNSVIDTVEKLGISDSLGKYKSDKVNVFNSYKDINLRAGEYYYAIVLVSQVKKKRVKLYPGINYTVNPVIVPARPENPIPVSAIAEVKHEIDSISNLKVRKIDNTVRLTWTPPIDADKNSIKYTVYRSPDPMSNEGLMEKATKLGETTHPETTFLDTTIDSTQTVYYGVTVTIGEKESIPLTEDKSFKKFYYIKTDEPVKIVEEKKDPIQVPANKKPLSITKLSAKLRKDGILFTWIPQEGVVNNTTKYFLYESSSKIANDTDSKLIEGAKKIGTIVHPDLTFLHPRLDRKGIFYYAVTLQNGSEEENLVLKEDQSFIKLDLSKRKKKKKKSDEVKTEEAKVVEEKKTPTPQPQIVTDDSNPDFETIMTQYYKKEKYTEALVKFKSLADRVSNNSLRGKSLFFAALCNYNLKDYSAALKILLSEDVQMNYDRERVDFYVKRCLENRGNK
ncbi:MAG TPA: hypothetical protein PK079_12505 [Leptospiraceae bacterium]|nr:hypothetical protein [Leptospiraceae bacterium]HMX33575.1 hypothetical protein [Leptospiraceae bacterium]HMY34373.1 hypothetical protein [Leptospiraceae bacterium]HMZ64129.1 hypothetical protein [Leptospiraceae bacterium]HNA09773.1 hypothetical protein [Leptospiraceae bacterium]